jgi:hypothetical protein
MGEVVRYSLRLVAGGISDLLLIEEQEARGGVPCRCDDAGQQRLFRCGLVAIFKAAPGDQRMCLSPSGRAAVEDYRKRHS